MCLVSMCRHSNHYYSSNYGFQFSCGYEMCILTNGLFVFASIIIDISKLVNFGGYLCLMRRNQIVFSRVCRLSVCVIVRGGGNSIESEMNSLIIYNKKSTVFTKVTIAQALPHVQITRPAIVNIQFNSMNVSILLRDKW